MDGTSRIEAAPLRAGSLAAGSEGTARLHAGAQRPGPRARRSPAPLLLALCALLAGAARAQDDTTPPPPPDDTSTGAPADEPLPPAQLQADPNEWGDGTWSGDEGSWESRTPSPSDPRDGQAEPAQSDAYTQGYQDGRADALADPSAGPTIDDFHGSLDSSGVWTETSEYGTVWRPVEVDSGWRPYSYGHWVYTSYGWTWASDEPWGWAVFHYGRWVMLGNGWAWIPGRVWGPAWVAWRWGGGYAGWCPLGPRGNVYWRSAGWWTVVEQRHFLSPVRQHLQPVATVDRVLAQTRALPLVRPGMGAGPIASHVAQATGRAVAPVPVRTAASPSGVGAGSEAFHVFAPRTRPIVGSGGGGIGRAALRQRSGVTGVQPRPETNPEPTWRQGPQRPLRAQEPPPQHPMRPQEAEPPRAQPRAQPQQQHEQQQHEQQQHEQQQHEQQAHPAPQQQHEQQHEQQAHPAPQAHPQQHAKEKK
jgi:hypothetical protein